MNPGTNSRLTIRTNVLISPHTDHTRKAKQLETKEQILDSALELFNQKGAYSVTTRHIASYMNISPGNLYYHYSNKEEIIRKLLGRMADDFSVIYKEPGGNVHQRTFNDMIRGTGAIIYKYRFFYAEIATLFEKDHVLRDMYTVIKKERMKDLKKFFSASAGMGIFIKPVSEEDFNNIAGNIWTMCEFMIQSMHVNGIKITRANISSSFRRIMHIIKPYLKPEVWDSL